MSLRRRTLYTVIGTFLGLIVVLYFVSDMIFLAPTSPLVTGTTEEGQISLGYLMLSIVGVATAFSLMMILLLERGILSRLSKLSRGVESITESGDITSRVEIDGVDELALLGHTINGMLGALVASRDDIRERDQLYRLLAENVSDVICTMDMLLNFVYVSPSVTRLTGWTPEEMSHRALDESLTPDSYTLAVNAFAEDLALEESPEKDAGRSRTLEIEMIRKDGTTVWVEARLILLRDDDGRPTGLLGTLRDTTERRQAAGDLQRRYERERDLREQVEAEIKKRIEFTRALVHELKTPITPVMAASELLLEEIGEGPLRALAENIERGAAHLNLRIDELLDMARGEIGTLQVELVEMNPLPVLREVGLGAMPAAIRNDQTITIDLPEELPVVIADEGRLRQVILNLMNNASKFTPSGGEITLTARSEKGNLVVEIIDTGRGIAPAERLRLFEPYARSANDVGRLSGLGLGLALAKTLVELQGGQIWVESKKGEGSTFGFSLPLAGGMASVAPGASEATP